MSTANHQPQNRRARTRSKRVEGAGNSGVAFDRPYKCSFEGCDKAFTRSEHLRRHQLNHEPATSWSCSFCPAIFVRRDLWQRHLKVSHSELVSTETRSSPGDTQSLCAHSEEGASSQGIFQGAGGRADQLASAAADPGVGFSWEQELETWMADDIANDNPRLSGPDIDWFQENQFMPNLDSIDYLEDILPATLQSTATAVPDLGTVVATSQANSHPPRWLQDSFSKLFVARTEDLEAPVCSFRICNALTDERRIELLMDLRNLIAIDHRDPIFSLNSMKQGIHLFFRNVSIEYTFLHQEFLIPSSLEIRQAMIDVFGGEPGSQLLWAVITTGWSLIRSEDNHPSLMASTIQRALRATILSDPALGTTPPLWLVQTLFLVLLFARYQGSDEEYGFASMFHGVLIEATRRIGLRPDQSFELQNERTASGTWAWVKWIQTETIQRLRMHTFILDVKQSILHGRVITMSPFELDIKLYAAEDAWWATSHTEWKDFMKRRSEHPFPLVPLLKRFWNLSASNLLTDDLPRGSNILLYGLISIAQELSRREESPLYNRVSKVRTSLWDTVKRSLNNWEILWTKVAIPAGITSSFLWRNCTCVLRLAHTLYEVSPVDLQTIAGKEVIEGKRRGPKDYAKSRRKLRMWVQEDRAWICVSYAAGLIQEHLSDTASSVHCHHCLWCLYLAGLICWNFGFALTGKTDTNDVLSNGQLLSFERAAQECQEYLQAAVRLRYRNIEGQPQDHVEVLGRTTGMLVMLIGILRSRSEAGMIAESSKLLSRLVGLECENG